MRFEAKHMKACGPGEVWWLFDNKTGTFVDLTFTTGFTAHGMADDMNAGVRDRNGQPVG